MTDWTKVADDKTIAETAEALKKRGIEVIVVRNGEEAKKKVLELVPEGADVMQGSSTTLEEIGVTKEIEESGRYHSLRKEIRMVEDLGKQDEVRKRSLGAAYGMGSINAITKDGQLISASGTGSQLALYAYGVSNLILVAGTHKIVGSLDEGIKRIYEYCLPLENERVKKVYGMPGSSVSKILVIEKERPGRIKLILVKEKLGF